MTRVSRKTSRKRQSRSPWIAPLLIVLACALTYANSLHSPFLFDDRASIQENPTITQLSSWRVLIPPERSPVAGRPVANLSFAVNYAIGGLDVWGYHVANVGIHMLAALLVFHVLRRTFARYKRAGILSPDMLALACALIWSVHALNSEVVNYPTERTESLMALFYLLALSCAIAALDSGPAWRWELCAIAAAICAVNSKEPGVTVPAAIVLWDRLFAFPTMRAAWAVRRRLYVSMTAVCLVFAFLLRTIRVSGADSSSWDYLLNRATDLHVSPWTYLLNEAPIIVRYLWLSIWPASLVLDYGFAQPLHVVDVWPALLFVAGLLAAAIVAVRFNRLIGFWAIWFFLTLGPTSSLLPIAGEVGAERRMYLPLVGVIAVVILALDRALQRFNHVKIVHPILATMAALVVVGLATATVIRNRDYQSSVAIWQTSVDRNPHERSRFNLAVTLRNADRPDEAIAQLRLAAPHSADAQYALGSALAERGDTVEAIEQLRTFIRTYPNDAQVEMAQVELGESLEKSGARGDAASAYRASLALSPNNPVALLRLGILLAADGNASEALGLFQRAVASEPRSISARTLMVQMLINLQRFGDAERAARELVGMAPGDAETRNLLGLALASQGRLEEARAEFAEALRLNPQDSNAGANYLRSEQRLATPRR